ELVRTTTSSEKYNLRYRAKRLDQVDISVTGSYSCCDQTTDSSTTNTGKEYRNAKNTHSLGAIPRNGRVPKPPLNAFWSTASSHQWARRDHFTRMDAAGGHHRRRQGISHQGRVA